MGQEHGASFGLTLSGGGLWGLAHVGVLRALEELGVRPAGITGTSAGALVGGLYAAGVGVDDLWNLTLDVTRHHRRYLPLNYRGFVAGALRNLTRGRVRLRAQYGALISTRHFAALLRDLTQSQPMSATRIPLILVASDLSGGTRAILASRAVQPPPGSTVLPTSTPLYQAILASMAVPLVFPSVVVAGRVLMDGGLCDGAPTDLLHLVAPRPHLAVLIGGTEGQPSLEPGFEEVATHSMGFVLRDLNRVRGETGVDLAIYPEPLGPLAGFSRAEALMESGYRAARAAWPEIRALLGMDLSAGDSAAAQG